MAFDLITLQLFIDLAIVLATCNIEKAIDNCGDTIIPDAEYTKQFIRLVAVLIYFNGNLEAYNDVIYIDTLFHSNAR